MELMQILIVSVLVEAIWENIKMIYSNNKISLSKIGSLIISLIICFIGKVDIFLILNVFNNSSIIGIIFTAIICSRGANFVNDIFDKINNRGE